LEDVVQHNKKIVSNVKTHEGGKAKKITPLQELIRTSLACMLWEDTFYEDGKLVADRISTLSHKVKANDLSMLAIVARKNYKLRHVPMWLTRHLVNHPNVEDRAIIANTIYNIIDRADEIPEFLSLYWKDGKKPIAAQVKKGLAKAFTKFDEYQLAKYNRDKAIKLRDVLFMVHAKPETKAQEILWKKLINDELSVPDTWEVALSSGKETKSQAFTRLINTKKLPAMATIKNIRLMEQSGVSKDLIRQAIRDMKTNKILPFRYVTAARYNPTYEDVLEESMLECLKDVEKLPGKTVLLIDVSGSMSAPISQKSDMQRLDAANGLAILAREICSEVSVYSFSDKAVAVAPRRGFALRDAINKSQHHGCTYLSQAIQSVNNKEKYDRIIVFTDEQSHDGISTPNGKGYCINVSSNQNGVAYGNNWVNVTGFSEHTLKYIQAYENEGF
jgi:hypothetical protein